MNQIYMKDRSLVISKSNNNFERESQVQTGNRQSAVPGDENFEAFDMSASAPEEFANFELPDVAPGAARNRDDVGPPPTIPAPMPPPSSTTNGAGNGRIGESGVGRGSGTGYPYGPGLNWSGYEHSSSSTGANRRK